MKRLAFFILVFALAAYAQVEEGALYGELFGVLSYLGVLLLSLLFIFLVAIPFIVETTKRKGVSIDRGPLSNRLVWATEISLGIILLSLTVSSSAGTLGQAETIVYVIAGICAVLPLAIFLGISIITDWFKKGILPNLFSMVLWGVVASSAALFLNQALGKALFGSGSPALAFLILTPFFEEALKGIGLAEYMKKKGTPAVLGMLYGFAIGIGFSVVENWLYFTYVTTPFSLGTGNWTQVLFYRSFFTTLAHGLFCAGNALVISKTEGKSYRFIAGLGFAFLLHLTYNSAFFLKADLLGPFLVLAMAFGFLYAAYEEMKKG